MTLRDSLTGLVLDRSRYPRELRRQLTFPKFEEWVAARIDEHPLVYVGAYSVTIPSVPIKMLTYNQYPCTDGELAREYLRLVWDDHRNDRPRRASDAWDWKAPLFCEPVSHRSLAYLDIESAYWQLIRPFHPDDVILPTGTVLEGELDWLTEDVLNADRGLRHAVVGSIFSSNLTVHRYGKPEVIYAPGRWASPSLKRQVFASLHAIAAGIRRRVPLYAFLTDAAVIDAGAVTEALGWLWEAWGITAKVKARGMGDVWSLSTHRVGQKRTRDLTNQKGRPLPQERRPFSNLRRVPGEQLRRMRIERLAKGGDPTLG